MYRFLERPQLQVNTNTLYVVTLSTNKFIHFTVIGQLVREI